MVTVKKFCEFEYTTEWVSAFVDSEVIGKRHLRKKSIKCDFYILLLSTLTPVGKLA